jgi:hypothetical protein
LGKQLELDGTQQAEYEQIVAVYREKMAAQRQGQAEASELVRKMREARQAGDDEQVRQIREQMRKRRAAGGAEVMQSFFDDVEKILRDDQKEKLGTLRARPSLASPRGEPGPRPFVAPERQIAQLRERLQLSDEQAAKFDALAGNLKQELGGEGRGSIADLMQQLREAHVAGDREEVQRIRQSLGARRGEVEKSLSAFAAQVEPTLSDEQKDCLVEFREQAMRGGGMRSAADAAALRSDPRMLLRAVRRLDLTPEQKDEIRAVESNVSRELRSAGRNGAAAVRADLDKQLRAILTSDQNKELDAILARQEKNGGRGRRDAAPRERSPKPAEESP